MKKIAAFLFILGSIISSCSTDFDVVGPYKETMIIDGFLDYTDSVQYVRIKKAFLGEGNVLEMAQQRDSTQYKDVLDVKLQKINSSNTVVATYTLVATPDSSKPQGTFYAPDQVLYKCSNPLAYDGSKYRLVARNTATGLTATSTVTLVKEPTFSPPITDPYNWLSNTTPISLFSFTAGDNTAIVGFLIRFHYTEYDSATAQTAFKSIELDLGNQVESGEVTYKINRPEFWEFLGRSIPVKSGVMRRTDNLPTGYKPLEFVAIEGSEDLRTYLQLQSSGTINIDVPTFTTVENGLGLFTSRVRKSYFRNMTANTIAAFDTSAYTRNLNFRF